MTKVRIKLSKLTAFTLEATLSTLFRWVQSIRFLDNRTLQDVLGSRILSQALDLCTTRQALIALLLDFFFFAFPSPPPPSLCRWRRFFTSAHAPILNSDRRLPWLLTMGLERSSTPIHFHCS